MGRIRQDSRIYWPIVILVVLGAACLSALAIGVGDVLALVRAMAGRA